MKVAWHEVPGNKIKVDPSRRDGRSASLVPEIFFLGKENDIFARNLINRPYGTGRVFLLFSRHFVPGYVRFDPSGIDA
jgi:hypothetical protein